MGRLSHDATDGLRRRLLQATRAAPALAIAVLVMINGDGLSLALLAAAPATLCALGDFPQRRLERLEAGLHAAHIGLCGFLAWRAGASASGAFALWAIAPLMLLGTRRADPMTPALAAFAVIAAAAGVLAPSPWDVPGASQSTGGALAVSVALFAGFAALVVMTMQARIAEATESASTARANYGFFTENANDLAILRVALSGVVQEAHGDLAGVFGGVDAALVGRLLVDLVEEPDRERLSVAMAAAYGDGVRQDIECRPQRTANGAALRFSFSLASRASAASAHELVAHVRVAEEARGSSRDRDLQKLLRAAIEANNAKSRFLANMSHELRTPLNAILGFSEIMALEMYGRHTDPRYRDYAGGIQESGRYLLELIDDLLDISRIEANKFELHPEPLNVLDEINVCVDLIRLRANRRGQRLSSHHAVSLPFVMADRRALRQILINLLANATKFTPPGGRIMVRAVARDGVMRIVVEDNGVGMSDDMVRNVGEPFNYGRTAYVDANTGAGLGLYLVKSLTEQHGGRIEIDSAPQRGTRVAVTLPLSVAAGAAQQEATEAAQALAG